MTIDNRSSGQNLILDQRYKNEPANMTYIETLNSHEGSNSAIKPDHQEIKIDQEVL